MSKRIHPVRAARWPVGTGRHSIEALRIMVVTCSALALIAADRVMPF